MTWFAKRHLGKVTWSLVGVMTLALIEGHAAGQSGEQKILASEGSVGDEFGGAVSISGNVAIIGSSFDDINDENTGSAYIYRRSGANWVQEAKLFPTFGGGPNDNFGSSVSISGAPGSEVAIVGSPFSNDVGSAYIYRFNGVNWVEEQILLASDGAASDHFGISVSISGTPGNEVAIVGAWLDDDNGTDSGSAYIYRFNGVTWVVEAKLLASDGAAGDQFGNSVSINGDPGNEVAIIGAYGHDDIGSFSGSVYIYRFNSVSWVEEQKLLASDGAAFDFFGNSVSISGTPGNEVAIVGARRDDAPLSNSGSAYIYRKSGANWVEEQKLLASDGAASDNFGISISISGTPGNEVAIVGALDHDDNGLNSGSAYIYRYNGVSWVEQEKLLASDGAASDFFGLSVSINGDVAIVGAPSHDDNGIDSGSAYIFTGLLISGFSGDCNSNGINDLHDLFLHKTSADCNDNGIPDECDIASGVSVDFDGNGIPDECLASCPPDVNGDGSVNVTDLLALLAAWGVCP